MLDSSHSEHIRFFTPDPLSSPLNSGSLTPESLSDSESRDTSQPPKPKATKTRRTIREFFIAPPILPRSQKDEYKTLSESSLRSEMAIEVDEVIGEYREAGNLYYFARYDGGIAHKFLALPFLKKYEKLVADYKYKKAKGVLKPFDPSAAYIHPLSRVKMKINISNNRATVDISSARSVRNHEPIVVPDSEEEESEDVSDGLDYGAPQPARRTGRTKVKQLPFSPKKTRSQNVRRVDDSDDDDDDEEEEEEEEEEEKFYSEALPGLRRSARAKVGMRINLVSDADYDSDISLSTRRKIKPKKILVKIKSSSPAFGLVRPITEIDYDTYPNDPDNFPLRKHRGICEKCHLKPAHQLLNELSRKPKKRKRKKSTDDEFEESDNEEKYNTMGGWIHCLKCPVSVHWRCLAATQRDEILKAAREREDAEWRKNAEVDSEMDGPKAPVKRSQLYAQELTSFICAACTRGGVCMGCEETALPPRFSVSISKEAIDASKNCDVIMPDETSEGLNKDADAESNDPSSLLFRCFTCKRLAHYAHLAVPQGMSMDSGIAEIADYYQTSKSWLCGDCSSYTYGLDKILAWRPYPSDAVEPPRPIYEPPNHKDQLPREYLVKWMDRSYRRTQWVPHMWLVSTNAAKLKNFLVGGTKVELLKEIVDPGRVINAEGTSFALESDSRASSVKPRENTPVVFNDALPDAEQRIPLDWKTVDRVLDLMLWYPENPNTKGKKKGRLFKADDWDENLSEEQAFVRDRGEQPSADFAGTITEWEEKTGVEVSIENASAVAWAFLKWNDLGYDQATWDTPPSPGDNNYPDFERAFQRFIDGRKVVVPKMTKAHSKQFDERDKDGYRKYVLKEASDLDLGQDPKLKLMPFQVDGLNWLCNNWWNHQHCILADEMGLGKTVQITTFLGNVASRWNAFPALVVVPNSTITNWVREFERWAPKLRVVPFYGEKKAREVIRQFELYHPKSRPGDTNAKFHVLVTTYEALINPKDFTSIFKHQPRWEVLVIDEGQRLKSDSSLLFKKLNELNSVHRIIMTGTPLNNNIRELFNLMNFLDPEEWHDLAALEKEHEELTEELVKQLHTRLRPYFLRRIKSEVLQLPPKNEVIVPVSMAPLQKEIYRSILSHNADLLKGLTQPKKLIGAANKGKINNVLMQLRKCLQHPYLFAEDIEPQGLSLREAHEKLIDASAKLRFLKTLLPKLKERGHRVLLFSQFVIALNVIEDFLNGEGHKFLRLDGGTKGIDRQRGMDEFNRAGSDIFIYLLTTRAGGVGINLFSADTVIIFDPDFNPHQDLQAIARAYRYGQQKTCLVFKLMVKESAEERIMQIGKKKLVLDHLIVQKMDDDEEVGGENVQSILTYGAQALFDADQNSREITYSDQDVDKLIEKTEKEAEPEQAPKEGGFTFAFAKIWAADKDSLEEVEDDDQTDSWAQALQKISVEREKQINNAIAMSGRGARRKAADIAKVKMQVDETFKAKDKGKGRSNSVISDSSAYLGSVNHSESDSEDLSGPEFMEPATAEEDNGRKYKLKNQHGSKLHGGVDVANGNTIECGLCGGRHGSGLGECLMTDNSRNLAEFREMLILHADDEPWDERSAAVQAIDDILYHRGHLSMIAGQPLHPVPKAPVMPSASVSKAGQGNAVHALAGPSTSSTSISTPVPIPRRQIPLPNAGSSKRKSSTLLDEEQRPKKAKSSQAPACLLT